MRAVRIHEYGGPDKLLFEDDVPDPMMQPTFVLIEAAAASVNPIDWKIRSGARQKDFPLKLPAILGRDVSGIVRSVGKDVRHLKEGDRVVALGHGTYAELVAIEGALVTHLPDGVNLVDAAALPLIALTGDQLVRQSANVRSGQTVIISGALGSVGRAAVHAAKKLGATVIAGVKARQIQEARGLDVSDVVAIDDFEALRQLPRVDAAADTVGGDTAAQVLARVKDGGHFGYASVLPEGAVAANAAVKVTRVFAKPDPSKLREFADDVRDGKFVIPVGRRLALRDASEAHVLGERGGIGKIILRAREAMG
jgi:NADPH:quinone reductase-like Zn-dependent oxidoreductase